MYTLRDKDGVMIAVISDSIVQSIINAGYGFFRPYKKSGEVVVTAYEIKTDATYSMKYGSASIDLYLWVGSVLIPK